MNKNISDCGVCLGHGNAPCGHTTTPEWEERFDEIQKSVRFIDYSYKRFCCGGDFCDGDHLGFIKDFIRTEIKAAEERTRLDVLAAISSIMETIPLPANEIDWPFFRTAVLKIIGELKNG